MPDRSRYCLLRYLAKSTYGWNLNQLDCLRNDYRSTKTFLSRRLLILLLLLICARNPSIVAMQSGTAPSSGVTGGEGIRPSLDGILIFLRWPLYAKLNLMNHHFFWKDFCIFRKRTQVKSIKSSHQAVRMPSSPFLRRWTIQFGFTTTTCRNSRAIGFYGTYSFRNIDHAQNYQTLK